MKTVKEVMTTKLHVIDPDASVQSAAETMKEHDVGILPVITKEGRAVGTITDRDIAVRGVAEGLAPAHGKMLDAMTPGVEFCYDDDKLESLTQHMGEKQVHRLLVIDRESKGIKGIVSLADVATTGDSPKMAGEILARCARDS